MSDEYDLSPMNVTINPAGSPTPGLANHGYKVWLAGVIMVVSSGLFVGARIATRLSQLQMGPDDYAIIGALATCIVQISLWLMSVKEGYGADYEMLNWPHQKLFNVRSFRTRNGNRWVTVGETQCEQGRC